MFLFIQQWISSVRARDTRKREIRFPYGIIGYSLIHYSDKACVCESISIMGRREMTDTKIEQVTAGQNRNELNTLIRRFPAMTFKEQRVFLEGLYERYNRREFVSPDPLELLYRYDDTSDREIAGFVASGLAYGNVQVIVRNAGIVLDRIGEPRRFVERTTEQELLSLFSGFRHRFTAAADLAHFFLGIQGVFRRFGTLQSCFLHGFRPDHETVLPALTGFLAALNPEGRRNFLLPDPRRNSVCKRLHLYLRWMVRKDDIDPGGWEWVSPAHLIVPIDTHMFRIGSIMNMTTRKTPDCKTAQEITESFRRYSPDDPARYDFALTRVGMRGGSEQVSDRGNWREMRVKIQ